MGRNQWWDKLNQVVSQLRGQDDAEKTALRLSAAFFRRAGQTQFAKETYVKLQDHQVHLLASTALTVPMTMYILMLPDVRCVQQPSQSCEASLGGGKAAIALSARSGSELIRLLLLCGYAMSRSVHHRIKDQLSCQACQVY